MTVLFDNRTEQEFPQEFYAVMEKIVELTLQKEQIPFSCEVSISLVNNIEIQQINGRFRGIDRATDVLSFPQLTFTEGEKTETNEKGDVLLGDIIISAERAKEQAEAFGHTLKREIAFLTAHSMLHLLGYDHMDAQEEKEMFQKQEEILQRIGISR